jgi:ParB/RepB/Spo0J family partition protein
MTALPITSISPCPNNPRQFIAPDLLLELAESIRQVGVLQPIVVRPLGDGYEIVAGERRWRAAQLAELSEIPAVVRELTDVQAAELAIVENLLRADVSAFEEAMGFRRLIDMGAHNADSLAEKLGKSRSHVFARLRLCKLCEPVKAAMVEGKIEASTAELLAKFDTIGLQMEALNELLDSVAGWAGEDEFPIPFRRAKKILQDFYPNLANAQWGLGVEFGTEGSCRECPKRTGNMPDAPAGTKGANVCTDRSCYRDRLTAYRQRTLKALRNDRATTLPTLEDHDEAFGQHFGENGFGYGAKWVADDQICYGSKVDDQTWHEVLRGLDVEAHTLISPDGQEIRAYPRAAAEKAAADAGRIQHPNRAPEVPKDRKQVIAENKRAKHLAGQLAVHVIDQAVLADPKEFLIQLILRTANRSYQGQKYLHARFSSEPLEALREMDQDHLQGVLVAMECSHGDEWCRHTSETWAKALGVDVQAFDAEVTEAYEAETKKG